MSEEPVYVQVQVVGVAPAGGHGAFVLLQDENSRSLPIHIGRCEAVAIFQRQNEEFEPPRPLTQDLALGLWRRLGAEPKCLRIDDFWQRVYYSKLSVEQNGEMVEIDCRPSDGIAMALTAGVPIYVAEHVLAATEELSDEDDDLLDEE